MAESITQEALIITGMAGATAASRYAGATTFGAPTTGTFAVGDYVVDQSGAMYVCTVAGTPGTWQLSGVSVNENIAGKNFIINGGMDIWQRGTPFTSLSSSGSLTYGADRWGAFRGAGATGINVSQVTSPGITGFQYAQRVQRASGNTATNPLYITQTIETRNSIPLAGQSVSVSFWARAGSNFSSASNNLTCYGQWGTGTDENLYNGYAGLTTWLTSNSSLTTSWQRFTYTGVIGSSSTEVGLEIGYIPTGTAGSADYFDITGVQLEIAPQATPFSRAGGSIGGELALCQRYYWQQGGSQVYEPYGNGFGISSTDFTCKIQPPVIMRTIPTMSFSNVRIVQSNTTTVISPAAVSGTVNVTNSSPYMIGTDFFATGLYQGYPGWISANNTTNSYIAFSAEL